jgi:prepilin-type N-terminal cleavage/methylation domain-containing protein
MLMKNCLSRLLDHHKQNDKEVAVSLARSGMNAFTLIELLIVIGIISILGVITATAARKVYTSSSLAVSANNIRQLATGGMAYLADNNNIYWPYLQNNDPANGLGATWWFGYETLSSKNKPEGQRDFNASKGPLGGYLNKCLRPDPSFALGGNAFKPKYRNGYIGAGYNVLLGGGFVGTAARQHQLQLQDPSKVVVFFTSAQVNTFQSPASAKKPMLEEFYGIDDKEVTVHFRHNGKAMVSYASGNAGFLPMDESTRDTRAPLANVGRFAPSGSTLFLK